MNRFAAIRRRCVDDRGAVSAMVAVLGLTIFVSLALVVDGGRQLGALSEAQNLADNAARFGSQEVDLVEWRATGVPIIDEALATQRVDFYLANHVPADVRVTSHSVAVAGDTVTVTVQVSRRQFFFPPGNAIATESATALDGVTEP